MTVFSQDHKVIGLQYAVTSMVFLLIGFGLMLMMRWQLAYPFQPMPFGGGVMSPEFYNQLGAMHGTIMIFLGVVPLAVGGFGNYLIPLQIGAADMAFPRLNMWSYWTYLAAGLVMVASFFLPGGAADSGWTSYPPLSIISASSGQTIYLSLYGGSIRFTTANLFALAFLPMFGLGGLTGLPLGLAATDIPLHDTYYVIGHFHYIVAPGTIFALFAGVYHWFPKVSGRFLNEPLGRLHFWGSLLCMNLIFFPMFIQGLAGLNRRLYDGGTIYSHGQALQHWNVIQGWAAWVLGVVQVLFLVNLVISLRRGRAARTNPREATTLEWQTTSPPAVHNFDGTPTVVRGPYEYSVPGDPTDFTPQGTIPAPGTSHVARSTGQAARRTSHVALGTWLFIASEVMLFGGLFSAYILLRSGAGTWGAPEASLSLSSGLMFTALLAAAAYGVRAGTRSGLVASVALGAVFLAWKAAGYAAMVNAGLLPSTGTFLALYSRSGSRRRWSEIMTSPARSCAGSDTTA